MKENRDEVRSNSLVIPMNNEEKEMVQYLALQMGLPMSAVARIAIKEYFRKHN